MFEQQCRRRGYYKLTTCSQFFHADDSDFVGLLCIARALEGGESDIVSVHHVYNVLRRERPDVLRTLIEPIWYFDRKGEVSLGQDPYIRTSVFYLEPAGHNRVYCKYVILIPFLPIDWCAKVAPQVGSLLHPLARAFLLCRGHPSAVSCAARSCRRSRSNLQATVPAYDSRGGRYPAPVQCTCSTCED